MKRDWSVPLDAAIANSRIAAMRTMHKVISALMLVATAGVSFAAPPDETPAQRDARMGWWREARFGMFVHWGLYAIPAGRWQGKDIPGIGEWIMDKAKIPVPEYERLVPQFNPVKFDARQWVKVARNAGQRYLVITTKHHDGFCLWDSNLTDYDIMATPFKRDVLRELADACREDGWVRLGFYYSILDWHHPDARGENWPKYAQHMKGQVKELLTGYGPIGVMWFDGQWVREWTAEQGKDLEAFCRSIQPQVIINNRVGKGRPDDGDYQTPEQKIPAAAVAGKDWETCMTMNDTWGYKSKDQNWKSAADLLRKLVDIASKGGNFLLNVGPTAEGIIPDESVKRLEEMGAWLKVNGESIYGTTANPLPALPWGRCTAKAGRLYLHVFDWPTGPLKVPGVKGQVARAYLLADADAKPLKIAAGEDGITIDLPPAAPDPVITVIVLELK